MASRDEIGNLVLRLIQAYSAKPETETLREIAVQVARYRETFDRDGAPDWGGKSWEYRQAMSDLYAETGVDSETLRAVQNGLRYHLGNHLRECLSPAQLKAAGLRSASPRARIGAHRADWMERARDAVLEPPRDLGQAVNRVGIALTAAREMASAEESQTIRAECLESIPELRDDLTELATLLRRR